MPLDAPDAAVDNDVLIKASCYGLAQQLDAGRSLAVLGAAKFVVASRIDRMRLCSDREPARTSALDLIARSASLEPSTDELGFAVEIETAAQRRGLELDAGESQLAAIVLTRGIAMLETGDKRAIRAFEALLDEIPLLYGLRGRLRCLEQIIARCVPVMDADKLANAVCAHPHVDKTLSICCGCFGPRAAALDFDGLASYIGALRAEAPRVLEA